MIRIVLPTKMQYAGITTRAPLDPRREPVGEPAAEQDAGNAAEDDQRADGARRLLLGHAREPFVELREPRADACDREHQRR